MKDKKVVSQALLCFVLIVSLILPGAVAGASSATAQPPEDRTNAHSAVGSFSDDDCLLTELLEDYAMNSGLADSPWPSFRQNLQGTGRSPYTGREISDKTNEVATITGNDGDVRTDGFWLDYVTIQREWQAMDKLILGELDVYAHTLVDEALFDIVDDHPDLWYKSSIGSFNTLRINPYGPEFDTGMVNPFYLFDFPEGVRTMHEVLNKFIDRTFIAHDIIGGLAWPRFTSQHTQLSDYARYYDGTYIDANASIAALEEEYRYDPVTGLAWLEDTMAAINDLAPGTITGNPDHGWLYSGDPIPMVIAIRSDNPILDRIGDYVVSTLRDMGFDAIPFKGDMAATLSGLVNDEEEITGGGWSIYTGGWVSTMLARDSGFWFARFHTHSWAAGIPAFAHLDVPQEFWDAAIDLVHLNFTSFDERDALYEICLPEHMRYGMFYLVDIRGFSPLRESVDLAADRAGGIYGSWMWALTAHFRDTAGNPQFGENMRVAMHDLLVAPWNPIAGSNTIYDMFPIRATGDMGTHPDTRDGLRWAGRIDRAEVILQTGLLAIATHPWVELSFENTITAPGDAWRDWDPVTQTPRTVQDALNNPEEPWGLETTEVNRYSVVYYPADIWDHPLHCGSTLSFADFLYHWILGYDRGQEGSPIYDPDARDWLGGARWGTVGTKFTVGGPANDFGLKVETWANNWQMDAERMVPDWYPNYAQGNGFWHTIALGIRGERAGEMAFGETKAKPTTLGWINLLDRDVQQDALVGYLEGIRTLDPGDYADANIPYYEFINAQYGAAGLGSFATEVDPRMDNLEDFVGRVNHLWVGSGAYYVDDYSLAHKWVRLAAFEAYPDPADRWLFLLLDDHELTITATAGEGGAIEPSGEVAVNRGESQTFTITPEEGYEVSDVLVDGESVGVAERYTFENVTSNHTIHATFEAIPQWDPWVYDENGDGVIQKMEALQAVQDYFAEKITKAQVLEVIQLYFIG